MSIIDSSAIAVSRWRRRPIALLYFLHGKKKITIYALNAHADECVRYNIKYCMPQSILLGLHFENNIHRYEPPRAAGSTTLITDVRVLPAEYLMSWYNIITICGTLYILYHGLCKSRCTAVFFIILLFLIIILFFNWSDSWYTRAVIFIVYYERILQQ